MDWISPTIELGQYVLLDLCQGGASSRSVIENNGLPGELLNIMRHFNCDCQVQGTKGCAFNHSKKK